MYCAFADDAGTQKSTQDIGMYHVLLATWVLKKISLWSVLLLMLIVMGTQKDTHVLHDPLSLPFVIDTQKDTQILVRSQRPPSDIGTQKSTHVRTA